MFPHAIAGAHIHMGTIAGKLNGVIPADDAERLADRVDVDAGRGLLGEVALEQRRDPAGVLDHLEPALHLAERVGEHLAVLRGEDPRDLLAVRVHQLADAEDQLGALRERDRAPGREGLLRGRDRAVDLLDGREVDLAGLLAGGRVVDGAAAPGLALGRSPADPVIAWIRFTRGASSTSVIAGSLGLALFARVAPSESA